MVQDQIRAQLKKLKDTRGHLITFCALSGLPYQRVWRFANGTVKKLNLEDGDKAAKALKNPAIKALLKSTSN